MQRGIPREFRGNQSNEDARDFAIRRKFESTYGAELKHSDGSGLLLSREIVIPHVLIYNVDPIDVQRFLNFMHAKAQRKGWAALRMLLDTQDAVEAGRNARPYVEEEVPVAPENPKPKTIGKYPRGDEE